MKKKPLSWRCKPGENLIEINRKLSEGKNYGKKKIFQSDQNQERNSIFHNDIHSCIYASCEPSA